MSLALLGAFRHVSRASRHFSGRTVTTSAFPKQRIITRGRLLGLALATGALATTATTIHLDNEEESPRSTHRPPAPISTLLRTYVVYTLCSFPTLVDWSPTILSTLLSVPIVKQITEGVVRVTFFNHFVGGDTAEDAIPLLERLRAENKGCLFAYSVEVDEAEAAGSKNASQHGKVSAHKQVVQETLHSIDVAADFEAGHGNGSTGRRTWVAIKLSAMLPSAESLRRLSQYLVDHRPATSPPVPFPGFPLSSDLDVLSSSSAAEYLSQDDLKSLREFREDLVTICTRAQERGIRLIFDAEHSWYTPAIDTFAWDMMRKFNKLPQKASKSSNWFGTRTATPNPEPASSISQPLVYTTYQAYLRRTPEYLAQSITAARREGFSIGVKLVRGAYQPHELAAHRAAIKKRSPAIVDTPSPTSAPASPPPTESTLSISPENLPPVWLTKLETDTCYNECARTLISQIGSDIRKHTTTVGVLFGTGNWDSANFIIDELARQRLAHSTPRAVCIGDEVAERVTVAQLYGMSDALTDHLVDRTHSSAPFVLKYIPYGHLAEVMPYLSRRAIENKSVLGDGQAARERRRAASELWARLRPW